MPTKKVRLIIDHSDNSVRTVYTDEVSPMIEAIGTPEVCRATDVEPQVSDKGMIYWQATLRDKQNTILSLTDERKDAITEEVKYLEQNILPNRERFDAILNGDKIKEAVRQGSNK